MLPRLVWYMRVGSKHHVVVYNQTCCRPHILQYIGQSEIINMLLTRSRSIEIDARNLLGFTPLMKAALQGRTRCAKLLLFAGNLNAIVNAPLYIINQQHISS